MPKWEKNVRSVIPYVPGEQPDIPDMIKLNTNENPYPPAPGVERMLKKLEADGMRLYPDPTSSVLIKALAECYGLKEEQLFVGVGSDDVLAIAFLTFFNSGKPVFFPDVTYSFYPVWANLYRIPFTVQPVDADFRINPSDYYGENGGVIFPNPNAPTGIAMPLSEVEAIIKHNPDAVVIVDEAYVDFGAQSALELIDQYDNLLVVQTFSKSRSMAGMRIGFACGNPELIRALNNVKYSFNSYTMNRTSLYLGAEAVKDTAYFARTVGKIITTREAAKLRLKTLGFSFLDSSANFLFARHKELPAEELFQALKKANIYVRYFSGERVSEYLRITIGTDEQMERLYAFLEHYLKKGTLI